MVLLTQTIRCLKSRRANSAVTPSRTSCTISDLRMRDDTDDHTHTPPHADEEAEVRVQGNDSSAVAKRCLSAVIEYEIRPGSPFSG